MLSSPTGTPVTSTYAAPWVTTRSTVSSVATMLVVQADGLVDGLEGVEAVLAGGADPEVQVDLGGGADVHAGGRRRSGVTIRGRRSRGGSRPTACPRRSGRSPATPITSPRVVGSMPACTSAASAASPEPASGRSAARSCLRRWAKAASTTAKTCSRVAVVAGGSRRVHATRPESTLGAGQKTLRPMVPARRTSANQAALTLRHAVGLGPGRRGQPVGDLGLHHHQPALEGGQQREHVEQHRHRDVVGQVGDQRGRRRPGDGLDRAWRRPARPRSGRPGPGRGSAIVSGSSAGQRLVDLDGHDPTGDLEQRQGQRPEARADLDHHVVRGRRRDSRTMRRTVLGSMTKFCPRCLVGRRSSRRPADAPPPDRAGSVRRRGWSCDSG